MQDGVQEVRKPSNQLVISHSALTFSHIDTAEIPTNRPFATTCRLAPSHDLRDLVQATNVMPLWVTTEHQF